MKLQFNLLPDVKQEYLKTRRTKRTIITASIVASAISVFILMIMLTTVYVVNKKQLSKANDDIKKYSAQLKEVKNLDRILTVQNQLKSLQSIHQGKHKISRIYTFLPQLTPANLCLSGVDVSLEGNTMEIKGDSDSQKTINTFIDTLKFTKYKLDGTDSGKYAFPSVIEKQFNIDSGSGSQAQKCNNVPAIATFGISVEFDTALFSNSQQVDLKVPTGLVTTRSVLDDPSNLFNGATPPSNESSSNGALPSSNATTNSGSR